MDAIVDRTLTREVPLTGSRTVHISRTMMLAEISSLLEAVPSGAGIDDYRHAVVADNVLMKQTVSNREKTFRFLRELYALDPKDSLFLALREFWSADRAGRPLIALLNAVFRDEVLRASVGAILATRPAEPLTKEEFAAVVGRVFPSRFGDKSLHKISRNIASTWTQSGHLVGHVNKKRAAVTPTIGSATFALLLAWWDGRRGLGLFDTIWAKLISASPADLDAFAFAASNRDWLTYKRMGDVVEIDFSQFIAGLGALEDG